MSASLRPELLLDAVHRLARGAEDADAFFEDGRTLSLSRQGGRLERAVRARDCGLGLRRVVEGSTVYGHTNRPDADGVDSLVCEILDQAPGTELAGSGSVTVETHGPSVGEDPSALELREKADRLARMEEWARSVDPRIHEVQLGWSEQLRRIHLVPAEGPQHREERTQLSLTLRCVASRGTQLQTAYNVRGGRGGLEVLGSENEIRNWTINTAEQALRMLEAQPAPAGPMTVVLSSSAGGTMVHEAIGHGLEADLVQKGLSAYLGRVGRSVAAEAISILDDATLVGRRGFLNVDDEGSPGQRTVLVEDGVLKGYLYDRLTARRDRVQSTGNGRRENYRFRPIVRMTNTMIAPGTLEPQAIIADTRRGLLVTRMGGGEVDTATGNFVFKVNEAFLLEDGKVGAPVRGATLIGNGPQILEQIDAVGNDLGFDLGTCGKDGQGVPVADAQPTLRIPSIIVGGERA